MDYYKYKINEMGPAPKIEGEKEGLVKKDIVVKTITVFTNDPKEIGTAPGEVKHMGKIDKKELDKLSKKKDVEVHTVK